MKTNERGAHVNEITNNFSAEVGGMQCGWCWVAKVDVPRIERRFDICRWFILFNMPSLPGR